MSVLLSDLLPYLLAAGAAIALWLGNNVRQRAKGRKQAENKRKDEYIETRKDMDDAEVHGDNADAAREWLSERKRDRDL